MNVFMDKVTAAYAKAVTCVFYVSIAGAVAGMLVSFLFRWVPLGEVHEQAAAAEKAVADEKVAAKNAAVDAAAVAKAPEEPVVVSV